MNDVNFIDKHVGERLRALRETRGISVEQLVRACKLSVDRLDRLENGRERINVDDMLRMCKALDVTPADFFRGLNPADDAAAGDAIVSVSEDVPIEEEGRRLLIDLRRILDARKRQLLLALAAAFAKETDIKTETETDVKRTLTVVPMKGRQPKQ